MKGTTIYLLKENKRICISNVASAFCLNFPGSVSAKHFRKNQGKLNLSGPPIGGRNHEFTVQIFEIHVFTHKFLGIHVHVNLICAQNLRMGEKVGKFLSLTVWWLSKMNLPTVSTVC